MPIPYREGKEKIGKKGVVRDPDVHTEVVERITQFALENGFTLKNLDFSPIKGPEGNIEYLMHIEKTDNPENVCGIVPAELVERSHSNLDS